MKSLIESHLHEKTIGSQHQQQFKMLITKLALPFCNIMHTQFVQFSCCAEPHNCAFCCTLSLPFRPTRLFLHATPMKRNCIVVLLPVLSLSTWKQAIFIIEARLKPKWNCRTRRVKIQSKVSGYFPLRNNYNALKDILEIVFNFFCC